MRRREIEEYERDREEGKKNEGKRMTWRLKRQEKEEKEVEGTGRDGRSKRRGEK